MSIYPGTEVEQSYQQGKALGREYAQVDRSNDRPFASGAEELRAEARCISDDLTRMGALNERAWRLGIARGYREEARSFERGRWGL
jgi:hypothetical protein